MEVISGRSTSSTLNPNAPMFVPLAYRMVEDFSDEWWALVQSSPWFRDYWLQERFCDPQTDPSFIDIYDPALSDIDSLLANEGKNKIFQLRLSQLVPISLAHWVIYIYMYFLWFSGGGGGRRERFSKGVGSIGSGEMEKGSCSVWSSEIHREGSEDCEDETESPDDSAA